MNVFGSGLLLLALVPAALGQDEDYSLIDDRSAQQGEQDAHTGRLQVPRNDGWVTDLAGLLAPAEERELEALMEAYKQGTAHEIALLTVPSLQGEPIEQFALDVGRAWKMGGKEKSNAALLVVSKDDRELRIEVGDGLEGTLTDSISGRIIRDVIVPKFRQGQFGEGLKQGVLAIHEAIGGDYGRIQRTGRRHDALPLLFLLPPLLIFAVIVFTILRIVRRGGRRGRRGRWLTSDWGPFIGGSGWGGGGGGGFSGGGFSGFGGGGGFHGGGASGRW